MGIYRTFGRNVLLIGLLLLTLLVAGCAGIKPYEPRDYREEGPEKGLISGADGEFVIYRKADEPETDSGAGKSSDETAGSRQQIMDSEKKKNKVNNGAQEP